MQRLAMRLATISSSRAYMGTPRVLDVRVGISRFLSAFEISKSLCINNNSDLENPKSQL